MLKKKNASVFRCQVCLKGRVLRKLQETENSILDCNSIFNLKYIASLRLHSVITLSIENCLTLLIL